jgi:protein gp37
MANRLASIAVKDDRNETFPTNGMGKYAMVVSPEGKWNGKTYFEKNELQKPFSWKKPRRIFVVSMGDLFHESVKDDWRNKVLDVMLNCPQHIFLILTKRPYNMADFFYYYTRNEEWKLPDNIWIGVTVENQEYANERIKYLNTIPAAVKFVSIEPMLGPIDLTQALDDTLKHHEGGLKNCISWVICGGESGPGARPMHPDWVRSLRDQCQAAGVPFFFKQWGEWFPDKKRIFENKRQMIFGDTVVHRIGKKAARSMLDGKEYKQYPEVS